MMLTFLSSNYIIKVIINSGTLFIVVALDYQALCILDKILVNPLDSAIK